MMTILSKFNSIAARITIAIVLAIILGLLMAFALSSSLNSYGSRQDRSAYAFDRTIILAVITHRNLMMLSGEIAMAIRTVASVPRSERRKVIAISAGAAPDLRIALDESAPAEAGTSVDYNLDRLSRLVQLQLRGLSPSIMLSAHRLPLRTDQSGDRDQSRSSSEEASSEEDGVLEAALPDGQRITFVIAGVPSFGGGYLLPIFLASLLSVTIVIAFWTARRLARPIREFARAAERLGVDLTVPPLAVRGPQELRSTIQTFNRMQERLRRFLEDRTEMLAAISHDLRAPLARLRLRAELVADGEQQRKMFDDLDSMNAMIESTLAFARDNARQEPRTLVDLGVLVGDVCEDAGDGGEKVAYAGQRGIDVPCRPTHIRRAVANLIDNAVKYGESARVKIVHEADRVVIVIDDDGPGIPADEQERVFWPFYRREPARDPAKAGVGLGLNIARTVAREHGGDVTLRNRDGGGLSALIELPV
jgi:signal transduction histidine kinase